MNTERWHVAQFDKGELVSHQVYPDYDYARVQIYRHGLWSGHNILSRASQCYCRGRLT